MREIVLGTAGHVDHGKTSLVKVLTGIETDRLKEEKKRGITIELGFAFLDLPCGHRLGIVDVPGHEKFVKNMVAGASGLDLVAFIVAADEGIMPQTKEHFEICTLLGIKKGIIIITKIDMVDQEWLDLVEEEVKDFVQDSFLMDAPVVAMSSTTGEGVDKVHDHLDQLVRNADFSQSLGPFRMPIDRIFSMKGFGAVVTGTSTSGCLKVGDEICIYPEENTGKVRGIQVHGKEAVEVEAGRRTAINVQGLESEMIDRGDMLASLNSLKPTFMLDCDFLYLSSNIKKLKNRARVRVHIGTAEIMGRIVLLEDEEALPGNKINVQILLEEAITAWPGDRYVVRSYSPVRTIGGGTVYNSNPGKKRRRFKKINSSIFELYINGTLEEQTLFHIKESGFKGLTFAELEVRHGIFGKRLKKIINGPISSKKIVVVDSEKQRFIEESVFHNLTENGEEIVTSFHLENPIKKGISKEEVRSKLFNGLDQKLFHAVLNGLIKKGTLVQDGAIVHHTSHQVVLQADAKFLKKKVVDIYLRAALQPPTRKELYSKFSTSEGSMVKEIIDLLMRDKILTKVTEDLYYHSDSIANLKTKLQQYFENNREIDAQAFKSLTNLSRKFSIPLMEYFDKIKFTIRVGNNRILR